MPRTLSHAPRDDDTPAQPDDVQVDPVDQSTPEPQSLAPSQETPVQPVLDDAPGDAQQQADLRSRLAAMGMGEFAQLASDDEVLQYLAREHSIVRDYGGMLQDYAANADAFHQWQQSQRGQPQQQIASPPAGPAQPQGKEPPKWFEAPPYDPAWERLVEYDDTSGQFRHKLGLGTPEIAAKVNAYTQWFQEHSKKLLRDPVGSLADPIKYYAAQEAERIFEERWQKLQSETQFRGFLEQQADWLLRKDPAGNVMTDPLRGEPLLSDEGRQFQQNMAYLQEAGITDRVKCAQLATLLTRAAATTQDPNAQAAPPQTAEAKRDASNLNLQRQAAQRKTNRNGTIPRPGGAGPSQNPSLGLRERLLAAAQGGGFRDGQTL